MSLSRKKNEPILENYMHHKNGAGKLTKKDKSICLRQVFWSHMQFTGCGLSAPNEIHVFYIFALFAAKFAQETRKILNIAAGEFLSGH